MDVGIRIFCAAFSRRVLMEGTAYTLLVGHKQVSEKFYLHVLRNSSADNWDLPEARWLNKGKLELTFLVVSVLKERRGKWFGFLSILSFSCAF